MTASIGTTKPMMTRIAVTIRIAVERTVEALMIRSTPKIDRRISRAMMTRLQMMSGRSTRLLTMPPAPSTQDATAARMMMM